MSSLSCCFVSSNYLFEGGAPRSMFTLVKGLKNRGEEVAVLTMKSGELENRFKSIDVHAYNASIPSVTLRPQSEIKGKFFSLFLYVLGVFYCWFKTSCAIYKIPHDSLCFNDIRSFLLCLPAIVFTRKKVVWYVRVNNRMKFITAFALKFSDVIILISTSCWNTMTDSEKLKYNHKSLVVHTGFDIKDIQLNSTISNKIILGTCGTVNDRKNIKLALSCLLRLPDDILERVEFHIAGPIDENYIESIKGIVSNALISDKIKFLGEISNPIEFMATLDAFVLTSKSEGLPRVVLEALSSGAFIISTPVDGVSDIIVDDYLGCTSKDYGVHSFCRSLLYFFEINDRRTQVEKNELASKRISYVKNKFSVENFVDNFTSAMK